MQLRLAKTQQQIGLKTFGSIHLKHCAKSMIDQTYIINTYTKGLI